MRVDPSAPERQAQVGALLVAAGDDEGRRAYVRGRWLEELNWLDRRAARAHGWYVALRLATIIGGVLIPAMVGVGPPGNSGGGIPSAIPFALGLVVAIAAATEGFFRFGDRWRHYRRVAETLKTEGWLFAEASGPYAGGAGAAVPFATFVDRVEQVLQADVEGFFNRVAVEKQAADTGQPKGG